MLSPVRFTLSAPLPVPPEQLAADILDLSRWPSFRGCGPVPGIRSAVFNPRTDAIVGSRIDVTNRDGSTHTEEVLEWDPARLIRFRIAGFSRPVSSLATHFDETWSFSPGSPTAPPRVSRTLELYPRSALTRPALLIIRVFLRRAIARHLRQLTETTPAPAGR